ncbi:MAG: hypothetical protein R3190_08100, partial [Thermoanaerobaculia bacterium]|nr:hypothetical protein [Thermoanaerobaculia bacterium]
MQHARSSIVLVVLVALFGSAAAATDDVVVTGRIVDEAGGPLAGCRVEAGAELAVTSGSDGAFTLVVAGFPQRIEASCEGRYAAAVELSAAPVRPLEIGLRPLPAFSGSLYVRDSPRSAVSAPGARVEASELIASGARSAAEGASRLPGVYVERERGDEERVLVRGGESRLVSTMIDGER